MEAWRWLRGTWATESATQETMLLGAEDAHSSDDEGSFENRWMSKPPTLCPEPPWGEDERDSDEQSPYRKTDDVHPIARCDYDGGEGRWDPWVPTWLFAACADGRVQDVQRLLTSRKKSKLNTPDSTGRTPLYVACQHGHVEIVRLLLAAGADIGIADQLGGRALCRATGQGHGEIVQLLIATGADVNARDSLQWTALCRASFHGHTAIAESLLAAGANAGAANETGATPLYYAAQRGNCEVVGMLLAAGVDTIMPLDANVPSPLHCACQHGHTETTQQLLDAGFNVDIADKDMRSPLHYACDGGQVYAVETLLASCATVNAQDHNGDTPLHHASIGGHARIVERLLSADADVNIPNKRGESPLLSACRHGKTKVVKALIAAGADVNDSDEEGDTGLLHACKRGQKELAMLLLSNRADVNKENRRGETPLHQASFSNHAVIVELLLAADAAPDPVTKNLETPLSRASHDGAANIVDLLLNAGSEVDTTDENGETPLFWASYRGHPDVVRLLLDGGARVNLVAKDGRSALHWATTVQVARMLIDAHADPNAVDMESKTPLDIASDESRYDVAHELLQAGGNESPKHAEGYNLIHRVLLAYWKEHRLGPKSGLLQVIRTLASRGIEWDETCEVIATQSVKPFRTAHVDDLRWEREASAIRACFFHWVKERQSGMQLTQVPIEQVSNGELAARTYIREIAASRESILRLKICVVGPSNWGKTSLVKSLTRQTPSLVHQDNRTIGIDHFQLSFVDRTLEKIVSHEVTFWDFAGQDAYQVAHSLFFSARTLFLVCIDLHSYTIARLQAELMTDLDSHVDRFMNDFLDTKVLRWIRLILARQPDAEFVFVATKNDRVQDDCFGDEDTTVEDLEKRLANVMVIVEDMKTTHVVDDARPPITHLWDPRLSTLPDKPRASVIVSSCASAEAVATLLEDIQQVIRKSDRGFRMPEKYLQVLTAVVQMRTIAARLRTDARLLHTFVDIENLIRVLQDTVQNPHGAKQGELYLDETTCRSILRTLHNLGDLLWYEEIGDATMEKTIILDPLLMIDFVRQVITHKHSAETMPHSKLKGLPFWATLDEDGFLYMKRVLQYFYLVFPSSGDMEWDSDLIVPAYWKSNTCAFWKFGGDILRLGRKTKETDLSVRLHWEFHFVNEFPDTLFDTLVVASYAPTFRREVGPDWILYKLEDVYACRIFLGQDFASVQRVVHLEAVLAATGSSEAEDLWTTFKHLSIKLERALHAFPGVLVSSFARNRANEQFSLKSVLASHVSPESKRWMPPGATWAEYSALAETRRR